jgi:hypothetical protein
VRRYTLGDEFGPFLTASFRKLPHALRAARKRARPWGRLIWVGDGRCVWFVRPNLRVTRVDRPR